MSNLNKLFEEVYSKSTRMREGAGYTTDVAEEFFDRVNEENGGDYLHYDLVPQLGKWTLYGRGVDEATEGIDGTDALRAGKRILSEIFKDYDVEDIFRVRGGAYPHGNGKEIEITFGMDDAVAKSTLRDILNGDF